MALAILKAQSLTARVEELLHTGCILVLLVVGSTTAGNAQDKAKFPTDEEIKLVLTQTDRAVQQYKPLIDQEEQLMGKSAAEAVANDRKVVSA